jgi:hypothetical protein
LILIERLQRGWLCRSLVKPVLALIQARGRSARLTNVSVPALLSVKLV